MGEKILANKIKCLLLVLRHSHRAKFYMLHNELVLCPEIHDSDGTSSVSGQLLGHSGAYNRSLAIQSTAITELTGAWHSRVDMSSNHFLSLVDTHWIRIDPQFDSAPQTHAQLSHHSRLYLSVVSFQCAQHLLVRSGPTNQEELNVDLIRRELVDERLEQFVDEYQHEHSNILSENLVLRQHFRTHMWNNGLYLRLSAFRYKHLLCRISFPAFYSEGINLVFLFLFFLIFYFLKLL